MGVFCDRLKLCSTAAPDCRTGQKKGRYREQELSFLLVSLREPKDPLNTKLTLMNSMAIPVVEFSREG